MLNIMSAMNLSTEPSPSKPLAPVQPPKEYECPITKDLMTDPVVLTDGFSYERKAIVEWMKSKVVSPMTGITVSDSIVPNTVLRVLICEWRQRHNVA
jgi:hypothetical protein